MVQKVLKVGSSAAVTIPKKSLEKLGLKIGDRINVDIDKEQKAVTVKPFVGPDKNLMNWTNKFIKRYRPALEELAKK
ncbi:AbrB/MazE/SpoVT family DNA-binding domain-containing protein [Patescibacteria group bacterium]